jgi:uncharacterized protein (DUF433 family)
MSGAIFQWAEETTPRDATERFIYTKAVTVVEQFGRITVEPGKCGGKPCIRGMRITVRRVLELLASYPDQASLLSDYPFLEPEDLQEVLRYAAATLDDELISIRMHRVA